MKYKLKYEVNLTVESEDMARIWASWVCKDLPVNSYYELFDTYYGMGLELLRLGIKALIKEIEEIPFEHVRYYLEHQGTNLTIEPLKPTEVASEIPFGKPLC